MSNEYQDQLNNLALLLGDVRNVNYFSDVMVSCVPQSTHKEFELQESYQPQLTGGFKKVFDEVKAEFDLIAAKPKHLKKFDKYYVFPNLDREENKQFKNYLGDENILYKQQKRIPANLSKEYVESLMSQFIEVARKCSTDGYVKENGKYINVNYLVGSIGSGKTMFTNYLSSYFSPILNQKQVIWINIRLTRVLYRSLIANKGLNVAIRERICWIVKNKYQHVLPLISKEFKTFAIDHLKGEYDSSFNEVLNSFIESGRESEGHTDTRILNTVKEYALHKEFSFIVVIDGLDEHEAIDNEYPLIIREVFDSIFINHSVFFLINMRPKSGVDLLHEEKVFTRKLLRSTEIVKNDDFRRHNKTFYLVQPKLGEVYSMRLHNFTSSAMSTSALHHHSNIRHIMTMFYIWLFEGLNPELEYNNELHYKERDLFRLLKDILGNNYRAIFHTLIYLFHGFLTILERINLNQLELTNIIIQDIGMNSFSSDMSLTTVIKKESISHKFKEILSKSYFVTEMMMCGSRARYKHAYHYMAPTTGDSIELDYGDDNQQYCFPAMHSLFKVACLVGQNNQEIQLLRKIRLLTSLMHTNKACSMCNDCSYEKIQGGRFPCASWQNIIERLATFKYTIDLLETDLKELEKLDLLRISYSCSDDLGVNMYYITRHGESTLTKYLYSYNYVYFSNGDMVVDGKIRRMFDKSNRRYIDKYEKQPLGEWALSSIISTLKKLQLIKYCEEKEIANMNGQCVDKNYLVFDRIYQSCEKSIKRIASGLSTHEINSINNEITQVFIN